MSDSDTPRTNSEWFYAEGAFMPHQRVVPIDFARQLERELAAAHAEIMEQARVNGMGGEREAKLMAELAAARLALAGIQETYSAALSKEAHRMIDAAMAKEPTDG